MKALLKSYSLQDNVIKKFAKAHNKQFLLFVMCLFCCFSYKAQHIGNYVANGSFEEFYDCSGMYPIQRAKYWFGGTDSLCDLGAWLSVCNGAVPYPAGNNAVYQYPRSGEAYALSLFYYPFTVGTPHPLIRGYLKNRLKTPTTSNNFLKRVVYLIKMVY